MMDGNNIAYLSESKAAVSITPAKRVTAAPQVVKLAKALDVAPWGEDNRFPQNVVKGLECSGVAQSTLAWKAKSIWGSGIVYGSTAGDDDGSGEKFKVAKPGDFPDVDAFFEENNIPRFFAEFAMDLVYFANCFPELIFDNNRKKIVGIIHQESADCRWKQMNERGEINTVLISKLWGLTKDQFVKYDKDKYVTGFLKTDGLPDKADNKYLIQLPAADMYFPMDSVKKIVATTNYKSFIFPVNYPSPNKTYYQLPSWDGCRLGGWIELSAKVPEMLKALYNNAFNLRYHIEIPECYFEKRFGAGKWQAMDESAQRAARESVLQMMDKFLAGSENAYKSFVSYFEVSVDYVEHARIKITPIDTKNTTDKDLLLGGTANSEIMFAMGVNPNILGAGKPGGVYSSNQGGSNIREGKLEHDSNLHLERQLALEPLNFIKKWNEWPKELEFRFKDTILTTLDTGKQTETQIK